MTPGNLFGLLAIGDHIAATERERIYDETLRFCDGKIDRLEVPYMPTVRRVNAQGEGEHVAMASVWLILARSKGGVDVSVRVDRESRFATDRFDLLAAFGRTCSDVAVIAQAIYEVL